MAADIEEDLVGLEGVTLLHRGLLFLQRRTVPLQRVPLVGGHLSAATRSFRRLRSRSFGRRSSACRAAPPSSPPPR